MRTYPFSVCSGRIGWALLFLFAITIMYLAWVSRSDSDEPPVPRDQGTVSVQEEASLSLSVPASAPSGPPWIYGNAEARFTVIEYADLECPYCRDHFTVLRQWIDAHPEVNWQWRHLPLTSHEPAATQAARLAECAGEVGGHTAFWNTVAWIYQQPESINMERLSGLNPPDPAKLRACLESARPNAVIEAHKQEAAHDTITATPTLRLVDHATGKSIRLHGPVAGDALLSAIDLLVAMGSDHSVSTDMPADPLSDMPR